MKNLQRLISRRSLAALTGITSVITGLIYVTFPVIEVEARMWGEWIVGAGVLSVIFAVVPLTPVILRAISIAGYALLTIAQTVPICLWLLLVPVTDGPEGDIGTRLYVVPHVLTALLSTATLVKIHEESSADRMHQRVVTD
jgi:hypothetical protein